MDKELSELKSRVESLETVVAEQAKMLTQLILVINLSSTDLKDHWDMLDT